MIGSDKCDRHVSLFHIPVARGVTDWVIRPIAKRYFITKAYYVVS
jgi:hypothetical protein